jgi:hypothetical protein
MSEYKSKEFFMDLDGSVTGNPTSRNDGITPIFSTMAWPNELLSEKEGRAVFDEIEVVTLLTAGDPSTRVVHPVSDLIKSTYPVEYARFANSRTERHGSGTPLSEWHAVSVALAKELESLNIYTVEALAGVNDANINKHPLLFDLRSKAKAWLDASRGGAAAMQQAAENERLKNDIETLKSLVSKLVAEKQDEDDDGELGEQTVKRRGRPRKTEDEAA